MNICAYNVVVPCFNEETVIIKFLNDFESKLKEADCLFKVIVVNDASTDKTLRLLKEYNFQCPNFQLKIINLKFNVGHQGAIKQGLICAQGDSENIKGTIVMDSDGEDNPEAILELIKFDDFEIVFVERGKRKENFIFKLGYFFYKFIFRFITGKKITFGNYSLISPKVLDAIYTQNFFHFPGFLSKQKFTIQKIKYDRDKRIDGESKMRLEGLVLHGLKSIVEYSDELLFFIIKGFFFVLLSMFVFGITIFHKKFISKVAIAGWASSVGIGLLAICLIIGSTIVLCITLISIKNELKQSKTTFYELENNE